MNIHAPTIPTEKGPANNLDSSPAQPCSISEPCTSAPLGLEPCTSTQQLLDAFREKLEQIPLSIPEAGDDHPLAPFAVDAARTVCGEPADDWENVLNPMIHQAFRWGEAANRSAMIQWGRKGLDGFLKFIEFYVQKRGLKDVCIREKVEGIMRAIDDK